MCNFAAINCKFLIIKNALLGKRLRPRVYNNVS